MSRYTGPKARVSRRLGTNIFGTKGETIALDKRPYPPGEHGRSRRRTTASEYLVQLQEKQKARYTYGLTERQFRNLYAEASRRSGVTGENMLSYLERRLDNVVYRAGWAATRPQARQFVGHGHVSVNGRRVTIPSYRVSAGDVVEVTFGKGGNFHGRFLLFAQVPQALVSTMRLPTPSSSGVTKDSDQASPRVFPSLSVARRLSR